MDKLEGIVEFIKRDKKGLKLQNNDKWFSSQFIDNIECSKGDKVSISLNKKGFLEKVEVLEKSTIESGADMNARLRRITDCVLSADQDFREGKIKKEDIFNHAKALHDMIFLIEVPQK